MKTKLTHFTGAIILSLFFQANSYAVNNNGNNNGNHIKEKKSIVFKRNNLAMDMRKLWLDHIQWTRNFIISTLSDLPDKEEVTTRLLNNQKDIGNAFKPYYGEDAAAKLTNLLTQHIHIAIDIVNAAKIGDSKNVALHSDEWYKNADEIALFLNQANPKYWKLAEMQLMMREHLKLTTDELMARVNKNWHEDTVAYVKISEEILLMADTLSWGLMKQFPKRSK